MKKVSICVVLAALAATVGCNKAVRYSVDEIRDYPASTQARIKNSEITTGMTKMQVRYSWGGPTDVNTLSPGEGGKERVEWVYKKLGLFKTRLIFTDGILTEIISNEPGAMK